MWCIESYTLSDIVILIVWFTFLLHSNDFGLLVHQDPFLLTSFGDMYVGLIVLNTLQLPVRIANCKRAPLDFQALVILIAHQVNCGTTLTSASGQVTAASVLICIWVRRLNREYLVPDIWPVSRTYHMFEHWGRDPGPWHQPQTLHGCWRTDGSHGRGAKWGPGLGNRR